MVACKVDKVDLCISSIVQLFVLSFQTPSDSVKKIPYLNSINIILLGIKETKAGLLPCS